MLFSFLNMFVPMVTQFKQQVLILLYCYGCLVFDEQQKQLKDITQTRDTEVQLLKEQHERKLNELKDQHKKVLEGKNHLFFKIVHTFTLMPITDTTVFIFWTKTYVRITSSLCLNKMSDLQFMYIGDLLHAPTFLITLSLS